MRTAAALCLLAYYVNADSGDIRDTDIPDGCGADTISSDCDCHLKPAKANWDVNKTRLQKIEHHIHRARELLDLKKKCYDKVKEKEEKLHKHQYEHKCDKLKHDTLDKQKHEAKLKRKWAKGNATRDAKHQYATDKEAAESTYKTSLQTATDDQKPQLLADYLSQVRGLQNTRKWAEGNASAQAEAAYKQEYKGYKQQYEEATKPFMDERHQADDKSRDEYKQKVDGAVDAYAQDVGVSGGGGGGAAPEPAAASTPEPEVGLVPFARAVRAEAGTGAAGWAVAAVAAAGAAMLMVRRAGNPAADEESQYGSV